MRNTTVTIVVAALTVVLKLTFSIIALYITYYYGAKTVPKCRNRAFASKFF